MDLIALFAKIGTYTLAHWQEVLLAIAAFVSALMLLINASISIAMMIPGEQPEKFLQSIVDKLQKLADFLGKYSKK